MEFGIITLSHVYLAQSKSRAMDDEALLNIKDALDEGLKGREPWVGISFGIALFDEFRRKGWITLESFDSHIFGFKEPMPAYKKTHHAFPNWGLSPYEYRIGRYAKRT